MWEREREVLAGVKPLSSLPLGMLAVSHECGFPVEGQNERPVVGAPGLVDVGLDEACRGKTCPLCCFFTALQSSFQLPGWRRTPYWGEMS